MAVGARRIRSEKMGKHRYRKDMLGLLRGKGVEWDRDDNVGNMWKQVKLAMVESARKVCNLIRVEGKKPKRVVE